MVPFIKTTNNGTNWISANSGLEGDYIEAFAISGSNLISFCAIPLSIFLYILYRICCTNLTKNRFFLGVIQYFLYSSYKIFYIKGFCFFRQA
jgi:hypothetical protein